MKDWAKERWKGWGGKGIRRNAGHPGERER